MPLSVNPQIDQLSDPFGQIYHASNQNSVREEEQNDQQSRNVEDYQVTHSLKEGREVDIQAEIEFGIPAPIEQTQSINRPNNKLQSSSRSHVQLGTYIQSSIFIVNGEQPPPRSRQSQVEHERDSHMQKALIPNPQQYMKNLLMKDIKGDNSVHSVLITHPDNGFIQMNQNLSFTVIFDQINENKSSNQSEVSESSQLQEAVFIPNPSHYVNQSNETQIEDYYISYQRQYQNQLLQFQFLSSDSFQSSNQFKYRNILVKNFENEHQFQKIFIAPQTKFSFNRDSYNP